LLALLVAASPQELHGPNTCTLALLLLRRLLCQQRPLLAHTSTGGLTIPSSGPAYGGPLKSNVSPLAHSMKKSVVRTFASGSAAFKRFGQLSLRRLHSGVSAARLGTLRDLQFSSAGALRVSASRTSSWVSLSQRFGTDRQRPQGSQQYTSAQAPLTDAGSKLRSSRCLSLFAERANPSFKRTRLRRSA
jgi:hypothetical protein